MCLLFDPTVEQACILDFGQVFLTSRAVYCIVFNLCDDLTFKETDNKVRMCSHMASSMKLLLKFDRDRPSWLYLNAKD